VEFYQTKKMKSVCLSEYNTKQQSEKKAE